ncbi:MAG: hypothetical protein JSR21_07415 [Proteobacteria bacterium]|nr:hypothetical protein [Pseudomonadota bacterium]
MDGRYEVEAYNTAKESENKIHDDAVARRFGFSGGLVPGVDVYAYMAHMPVARWGRAWLERGAAECRFAKPVYDGEKAQVASREFGDGRIALKVESLGLACASGEAWLPDTAPAVPADNRVAPAPVAADARPKASEASLPVDRLLGIRPMRADGDFARNYLRDLRETDPLYAKEGLLHPGLILRLGNWALSHNVVLGPWIHVGSRVQNLGVARVGQELTALARVVSNHVHKGHKFVVLDVIARADGAPVARIEHTAIYEPRQVQEAA